jgi:glyoxylase-like metal-dependent hydrolase (beta-lactamase superfamily II)
MQVAELRRGLWRWTAPHPEWHEGADWEREVGCVYYESRDATVLIDPLIPPERAHFLDSLDRDVERHGRPVAILLTCAWHTRSSEELAERYGATDRVPEDVVAVPFELVEETMYWLPAEQALVPGDALMSDDRGRLAVCPDTWLEGDTPVRLRERLRDLLELPLELVLVSHGQPVLSEGRAALEAALRD